MAENFIEKTANRIKNMTGIVILNYNTCNDVLECVRSIKDNIKAAYRIYVVDNCSTDDSGTVLETAFENDNDIILLHTEKNLGYSGGNNVGIKIAVERDCVDNILVINPDVRVKNDIISYMLACLDDDTVYAGPYITDLDNLDGQRVRYNYNFKYALFDKKPFYYLRNIFNTNVRCQYNRNKKFVFKGSVSGCCFLFKAYWFKKIGYFDDNVFLYSEEYIIGKKLEKLDKKTVYVPKAKVIHCEGSSTHKISNAFVDYHMYASEYYLLKRYCNLSSVQSDYIKKIRLLNYKLKIVKNKSYNERYSQLKIKIREIDMGKYKINY